MRSVLLVLGVLAVATAFGLWRRSRDGRFARVTEPSVPAEGETAAADLLAAVGELGPRATFVQFSSEMCAPCRTTHRALALLVEERPDVRHVDLDAARHLDLVRRHDVRRTPTVLVLDAAGVVVGRASGPTGREAALAALAAVPAGTPDEAACPGGAAA